jgi:hypothetical protein
MRRMIFVAFLFCFIQVYAKTPPPIPEALLNAKTAFVKNGGAQPKDFEKLCKLLKEWGRFELMQDQKGADIFITISGRIQNRTIEGYGINGGVTTVQELINYLKILDTRSGEELWSDETSAGSSDPRQLVSNLKNRMTKK